jgi:hypothetical protein
MKVIPITTKMKKESRRGPEQLDLIDHPTPISRTLLESPESSKLAYYEVTISHINGVGFVIRKASGARGAKPNVEMWFRNSYKEASIKKEQLISGKLRKANGRLYKKVADFITPKQEE